MRPLSSVANFGSVDADNDSLLQDAFEDHEAYINILKRSHFLVIGRKGTGKTAIFKKLLLIREHDTFSFGHTFTDYPWHHHDAQARLGVPDFEKYKHSWLYFVLLSLSKIILNYDQSLPYDDESTDSMAMIEKFVVDTYGSRDVDVTRIFTPAYRLKWNPKFEIGGEILKGVWSLKAFQFQNSLISYPRSIQLLCVTRCAHSTQIIGIFSLLTNWTTALVQMMNSTNNA